MLAMLVTTLLPQFSVAGGTLSQATEVIVLPQK